MQIYFMFVTKKGKITTVPVDKPENTVDIKIDAGSKICCLATKNSVAYLGTEEGYVAKVDLNSKQIVGKYDSGSKLPIFNLKIVH